MDAKDTFIKSIQENERLSYKVATSYTDCKEGCDSLIQEI